MCDFLLQLVHKDNYHKSLPCEFMFPWNVFTLFYNAIYVITPRSDIMIMELAEVPWEV